MREKVLKISVIFLLMFAIVLSAQIHLEMDPYPFNDFSKDTPYRVLQVMSGDTVEIQYGGTSTPVRLIGIEKPAHESGFEKKLSLFLQNLLHGESVYLRFEKEKTNARGQMTAYLYRAPDGLFVNLEVVRQGYGYVETDLPFKYKELFQNYAFHARVAEKGVYAPHHEDRLTLLMGILGDLLLSSVKLKFIEDNPQLLPDSISLGELNSMLDLFTLDSNKLKVTRIFISRLEDSYSDREFERFKAHYTLDSTKLEAIRLILAD